MYKFFLIFIFHFIIISCSNNSIKEPESTKNIKFGFNLDNYKVISDTIDFGDSFGEIMEKIGIGYPKIYQITNKIKDSFDVRWLTAGKPYTILRTNDSLEIPKVFISVHITEKNQLKL